jgi:UDPglucose 6-dehydrogenase
MSKKLSFLKILKNKKIIFAIIIFLFIVFITYYLNPSTTEGMENTKEYFEQNHADIIHSISFTENQYDAIDKADALAICTEWNLFRTPDFDKMKMLLKNKSIFDGRNLYDMSEMQEKEFYYNSIGRNIINF